MEDRSLFQLGDAEAEPYQTMVMNNISYDYYNRSFGTYPLIDGSTVLVPLAAEFAWQFLDLGDDITKAFIRFNTTPNAIENLLNRKSTSLEYRDIIKEGVHRIYRLMKRPDIILVTTPSLEEYAMAANVGIELIVEPICYDSFVFITHKDNPVESLTVEQVRDIYSGKITNWKEVGGNDQKIIPYQREANSGSQTAMEENVMKGIPMIKAPQAHIAMGMNILVDRVAEYENGPQSIGYTFKYYVDKLYTSPDIKMLKIDGVEPSGENIRSSAYPFIEPYNAVILSEDADGVGGKFLEWLLSEEGQKCIKQAGYTTLAELG